MFEIFSTIDWSAILKIIGIDIMLGVDNAVVIALACASLMPELRQRAIVIGTAGAILLRVILLVFATYIIGIPYVKFIAGAYLLYIGYSLLMTNEEDEHHVKPASDILGAIKVIIIADFMMSLDNVLAVTAASASAGAHSTIYAIGGIILSIPIIVFGAQAIMKLMDRFPVIIWVGAGMLGWVGAEMIISDPLTSTFVSSVEHYLGNWTHLGIKIAGFSAVVGSALFAQRINDYKDVK